MELVIAVVVIVAVGALIYFNRSARSLDINQDGRVDAADAVAAVEKAAEGVATTVSTVTESVTTAARSRATSRKSAAKPTAAKKPRRSRKTSA